VDLGTVEENVESLDVSEGFDLIFDLLLAYGLPRASIARLRQGSLNQSEAENEVLWKTKVYYRFVPGGESGSDLLDVIDDAASETRIVKQRPRFLIVCDSERLLALPASRPASRIVRTTSSGIARSTYSRVSRREAIASHVSMRGSYVRHRRRAIQVALSVDSRAGRSE
jgi:hypothetical protein